MSAVGYIQVHVYASRAQIPLAGVPVAITDSSGSAIALRLTDRSGKLEQPVEIPVPDRSASQSPGTGVQGFATVNLYTKAKGYEEISIENLQVFPNTVTWQNLEMIPLAELPDRWNKAEVFDTPPQSL